MQTKTIIYTGLILLGVLAALTALCNIPSTAQADDPAVSKAAPDAAARPSEAPKPDAQPSPAAPGAATVKDIRVTAPAASALQINVWIDRKDGVYKLKQPMTISYQAKQDCYVSLFRFNPNQTADRIFPTPEKNFNFMEAGRIYTLKADAGPQAGNYVVKAVATLGPSNAVQPGVKFKGGALPVGPLRVIPLAKAVVFADWELTRFFHLPADRYSQQQVGYTVQQ